MQSTKYIIGHKSLLDSVMSEWLELETGDLLVPIQIELNQDGFFDFIKIRNLNPKNNTAFIAWGSEFMNFQRLELFMELKKIGFKLPPLICRNSFVAEEVLIAENSYIGNFTQVQNGTIIGVNSYLMSGVIIESNVKVGNSCFIESGSILKKGVKVGDHNVIKSPTFINESVSLGAYTYLDSSIRIDGDIQEKVYITNRMTAKIYS